MANRIHLASRLLKLCISVGFFLAVKLQRAALRVVGKTSPPTCVILYYHSIAAECRQAFARQMDTVARLTTPIDLEDVPRLLPGKYYSAITFDDGFQDAIENAVPELASRGIHATFFVTVGPLGKPAAWWPAADPERMRPLATEEHLRSLPERWIRVGAHTMTHTRLSSLEESEARYEIVEPRRRLQSLMGYEIKTLSFPYGDFNEDVVRWSREAGYERAFTTQHQNAAEISKSFLVGRVIAEPTDWNLEFRLKLLGAYLWLPQAIALKCTLLRNSVISRTRRLETPIGKKTVEQG
jgi:peptidoglycan/xylan/chitin deacetylase (PgdA/CDA1 family)